MNIESNPLLQKIAAVLFALALLHTFSVKRFERAAAYSPRHAGLFHLLGEVEIVFGFWAIVLIACMALTAGSADTIAYAESRNYTEPLFVFVVMVIAASRPILHAVEAGLRAAAHVVPLPTPLMTAWLSLAVVPLFGSLITEPAAMTIAALMLAPQVFQRRIPEGPKYLALGVLFVNVSIGGTLTSYAAPPVLMVASTWHWDSSYMLLNFGWKAALVVLINATLAAVVLRKHLHSSADDAQTLREPMPAAVVIVHILFLIGVVTFAHHPIIFVGLFLMFLGFTQAYDAYQRPLIIKEALLVGFFLAGLVLLGGMQRWWLQPIVSSLEPLALFAGAVAGGGLTVIANAPNPAGVALLKRGFADETVGAGGLLLGAAVPTLLAAAAFIVL